MKSATALFLWAVLVTGSPRPAATVGLENDRVKVTVEPEKGGAVTSMLHKKAAIFSIISERSAGVAGLGTFFTSLVTVGSQAYDLSKTALVAKPMRKGGDETVLRMSASVAPGLSLERAFRQGSDESGFRLTETFRNSGPQVTLRLGGRARHEADWSRLSWLRVRSWFGDSGGFSYAPQAYGLHNEGHKAAFEAMSPRCFWRVIGPYGVGFLYQVAAPRAPVTLSHTRSPGLPLSLEFEWQAAEFRIGKGESVSIQSAVLIDEGGREGNDPSALAASDRMEVTADLRAARKSDEPMPAAASVVSAGSRKVRMVVREGDRTVEEADLRLEAGKACLHPFTDEWKAAGKITAPLCQHRSSGVSRPWGMRRE